jgi:4'-phosphopantetheinyl transferase
VSEARIAWVRTPADFAARDWAMALMVALDDPLLSELGAPAPNAQDLADLAYAGAGPRGRFLERRALLRALVGRRLRVAADDVVIAYRAAGAPFIATPADCGLHVSVAGRDAIAAFAIAPSQIGVDIEILDAAADIVPAALHPTEAAGLASMPPADRQKAFLRIWTAKEAYLKALGTGLVQDPATMAIAETAGGPCVHYRGEAVSGAVAWREEPIAGRVVIAACVALAG